MKIIVIRHGETTGDVEDRYGGDYNDHQTDKGSEQAKMAGEKLESAGINVLFSSPLVRAQEAAGIIAGVVGCPVEIEAGVKERNQYGILSGMVKAEARQKYPEMAEALKNRLNTIEGAETYEAFSDRVAAAFKRLTGDERCSCIGIVWHGGPMRVLFRDILKLGELRSIGDCSFVELDKSGDKFTIKNSEGIEFGF